MNVGKRKVSPTYILYAQSIIHKKTDTDTQTTQIRRTDDISELETGEPTARTDRTEQPEGTRGKRNLKSRHETHGVSDVTDKGGERSRLRGPSGLSRHVKGGCWEGGQARSSIDGC